MNLPNKLTVLRIILIPVFATFYFLGGVPYNFLIAGVIFALAAITDFFLGVVKY